MGQIVKTWTFDSGMESWNTDFGNVAWNASDGSNLSGSSAPGCLSLDATILGGSQEGTSINFTWSSLGVPVGATVTNAKLRCRAKYVASIGTFVTFRLWITPLSGYDPFCFTTVSNFEGGGTVWTTRGMSVSEAVSAGHAGLMVALAVNWGAEHAGAGPPSRLAINVDSVELTVDYTVAGESDFNARSEPGWLPAGGGGHVTIFNAITPIGPGGGGGAGVLRDVPKSFPRATMESATAVGGIRARSTSPAAHALFHDGAGEVTTIQETVIDSAKPTAVFWYHENRLYASFGGRTFCRDVLAGQSAGWTDCGYGYVHSAFVVSRFGYPHMAFLAANLKPLAYGDRADVVSLTHRNLTWRNLNTDVVPTKRIQYRPMDGGGIARERRKWIERFRVWGELTRSGASSQGANERQIGTLTCTTETGYQEIMPLYEGLCNADEIANTMFSMGMAGELLTMDLELFENVVDATVLSCMMEYVPES